MAAIRQGAITSGEVTAVPSVDFVYLDARSGKFLADSEAGLLAALASPTSSTSPSASVAIDPALVGSWQVFTPTPQGKRRITFEIRPTGTYTLAIAGPGNAPSPESGLLRAGDGMWMEVMSNGQTDQGKYSVPDPETLVLTTQQGQSLTWKRASAAQRVGRANAAVAEKPASPSPHADAAVRPR